MLWTGFGSAELPSDSAAAVAAAVAAALEQYGCHSVLAAHMLPDVLHVQYPRG